MYMCQRVNHGSTTGVPMCGHSRQGAGEGSAANVAPLDRLARGVDAALPGAVALQHVDVEGRAVTRERFACDGDGRASGSFVDGGSGGA